MITDGDVSFPDPPKTLGEKGAALWRSLVSELDFRPDELAVLEAACAEVDLIDFIESEWISEGRPTTTVGSRNQLVPHPAVQELRQHRTTLRQLLGQLSIPEPDEAGVQDPMSRARRAARARWGVSRHGPVA